MTARSASSTAASVGMVTASISDCSPVRVGACSASRLRPSRRCTAACNVSPPSALNMSTTHRARWPTTSKACRTMRPSTGKLRRARSARAQPARKTVMRLHGVKARRSHSRFSTTRKKMPVNEPQHVRERGGQFARPDLCSISSLARAIRRHALSPADRRARRPRRPAELAPGVVVQQHPEGVDRRARCRTARPRGSAPRAAAPPDRRIDADARQRAADDDHECPTGRRQSARTAAESRPPPTGQARGADPRAPTLVPAARTASETPTQHAERAPEDVQPAERRRRCRRMDRARRHRYRPRDREERGLHAVDERPCRRSRPRHRDAAPRGVGARARCASRARAIRRPESQDGRAGHAGRTRGRISAAGASARHAEDVEVVVHG